MIRSTVKLPRITNLLIMYYRLPFVVAVTICVILNNTHRYSAFKHRGRTGANGDVFNVLLGLYKLNPLRGSQVYKEFSDHVLNGHGDKSRIVMNFDSNESIKEDAKIHLNEIERMLHITSKKPVKTFQTPEYDIDDADVENFGVDIILNNLSKEELKRTFNEHIENFDEMFEHLGSNEVEDEIPVTKLLPVNSVIQSQVSNNQNEAAFKHKKDIWNSLDNIGPLVEVRNYIQDEGVMNKKFDAIADVVVL